MPYLVESLRKQVKIHATNIISAEPTQRFIGTLSQDQSLLLNLPDEPNPVREKVLKRSQAQDAYDQQCLYRACATITTFKVRDPDPNAVDNGNILGIRFEVMAKARFLRPYYVMLNRPYRNSRHLRVHRHTIPPCIPLGGLAARHLTPPNPEQGDLQEEQNLTAFVRALRKEIVKYHNRIAVIADLRKSVGLENKKSSRELPITDISAADSEAKQVKVEWRDGRTGRVVMDDNGKVLKLVVYGESGRDRQTMRDMLSGGTRIEDVAASLTALSRSGPRPTD
jgi:central kinetochore subunit Mal2/MCM21